MAGCELALESVGFRYRGGLEAVREVNLQLRAGIVGLLGPNGAGKSTLMRVLATLAKATSGRVLWGGVDIAKEPDALRAELGYLPQDFGLYDALSAREFLRLPGRGQGRACAIGGRSHRCMPGDGRTGGRCRTAPR